MADQTETLKTEEFIEVMRRCRDEISELRAHIARIEPKAEAYDNITAILRLLPRPSATMGEDLVWRLNKRIAELTKPA